MNMIPHHYRIYFRVWYVIFVVKTYSLQFLHFVGFLGLLSPDHTCKMFVCLFDLILYVPSTIFQLNRGGFSWLEPVLSYDKCVLLKDHNSDAGEARTRCLSVSSQALSHCAPLVKYECIYFCAEVRIWIDLRE